MVDNNHMDDGEFLYIDEDINSDDGYIYMKYKEYPLVWEQYCASGY